MKAYQHLDHRVQEREKIFKSFFSSVVPNRNQQNMTWKSIAAELGKLMLLN